MKKLFLFASIAALVAACGKNDDNTPQQPVAQEQGTIFPRELHEGNEGFTTNYEKQVFTFNAEGLPTKSEIKSVNNGQEGAAYSTREFIYYSGKKLLKEIKENGQTAELTYNAEDKLTTVKYGGQTYSFEYQDGKLYKHGSSQGEYVYTYPDATTVIAKKEQEEGGNKIVHTYTYTLSEGNIVKEIEVVKIGENIMRELTNVYEYFTDVKNPYYGELSWLINSEFPNEIKPFDQQFYSKNQLKKQTTINGGNIIGEKYEVVEKDNRGYPTKLKIQYFTGAQETLTGGTDEERYSY
ncbi:hypothetical protein [uncultured Capnocytophaga sp.]|uniref:hypothetical protein n=1 Tax=uncultured Capnocytophaga sp. TaxID=159273 RepID=UPI0026300C6B|nr:hypothetical protein [uncultured Capnocytophaga sp.]